MATISAAPGAPAGPFLILINAGSGNSDADLKRATIEQVLDQAGRSYRIIEVKDPSGMAQIARDTVEEARASNGTVVVAGGDGTINTVVNAVVGSSCALGVLPQGTYNYFGRAHGIPEDLAEATRALLDARIEPVQVGLVNDRLFVVNASLGLYPKLLEDREAYTHQYGRNRIVATWAGLMTVLRWKRPLRLQLEQQGKTTTLKTFTLFVGNNRLQMEQTGIPLANALETGQLAAVALRPVATMGMLWLLVRGAFNRLGDADNVVNFGFTRLLVKPSRLSRRRKVKVATDGEICWLRTPLEFQVSPQPLLLLKPSHAAAPGQMPSGPGDA